MPWKRPPSTSDFKIISFIYERTVIKKILIHLKLYSEPAKQQVPPVPEAPAPRFSESVEYVLYDGGWPGYEEPAVDVKSL